MAEASNEGAPRVSRLQRVIQACLLDARPVIRLLTVLAILAPVCLLAWTFSRFSHYSYAVPVRSTATALDLALIGLFLAVLYLCISHVALVVAAAQGHRTTAMLARPTVRAAIDQRGRADVEASRALADIGEIERYLTRTLPDALRHAVQAPIALAAMVFASWILGLLICLLALLKVAVQALTVRAAMPDVNAANQAATRALSAVANVTNAGEAVEAMGMIPRIATRWADDLSGGSVRLAEAYRRLQASQALTYFIMGFCQMMPFLAAISLSMMGMSAGNYILVLLLSPMFFEPVLALDSHRAKLRDGQGAVAWVRRLAETQPTAGEGGFPCPHGRLSVQGLMVGFPGQTRPTLRNLSLTVEPGEVVGVAGPVGCGKSTLLRAIMGIQLPTAGACYLDGHATWQWDRTDFARHVGYLPQDVGVADTTVAEVIARLGVPDMRMVIEAAQRAGAHDVIVGLDQGYATRLTENGLSAGQRQRVALARAIYGRPKLVVLDEPSAWLDEQGVDDLRRMFAILKADGISVLFTSHDLRLMDSADQVFALGAVPGQRPAIAKAAA